MPRIFCATDFLSAPGLIQTQVALPVLPFFLAERAEICSKLWNRMDLIQILPASHAILPGIIGSVSISSGCTPAGIGLRLLQFIDRAEFSSSFIVITALTTAATALLDLCFRYGTQNDPVPDNDEGQDLVPNGSGLSLEGAVKDSGRNYSIDVRQLDNFTPVAIFSMLV